MKKWFVIVAILILLIAHQDYWQWERNDLILGFVPYNMAYHIGVSVVTAVVWIIVCFCFWPEQSVSDFPSEKEGADQ